MIRLNLLDGKVDTTVHSVEGLSFSEAEGATGSGRDHFVKLLLLALPVVGLLVFESMNMSDLEAKFKAKQTEQNSIEQTLKGLRVEAGETEKVKKEIGKLEEKLALMTDLSKKRLKELKALDYLQNVVPDGVWLESINYGGNSLSFKGASLNDNDLNEYLGGLKTSQYFQNVLLLKSSERKDKKATVKQFEVSAELGSVE